MNEPLNDFEIVSDKAYRKLSRKMASSIIFLMAETDCSLEDIASTIRLSREEVCSNLQKLIEGHKFDGSLDYISSVLLAMGAEPDWKIQPKQKS